MELQSTDDVRAILTLGEAVGVAAVLWELGNAIKDTTDDPDCFAAAMYHEAASIEDRLGLPPWPTDARTTSAVADFYHRAALALSAPTDPIGTSPLAPRLEFSTVDVNRLVDLLRRGVATLGADGLSSTTVHAGSCALAWALILSTALVGLPPTRGGEANKDGLDDVLDETRRRLRRVEEG
jgi:hypothetical protein